MKGDRVLHRVDHLFEATSPVREVKQFAIDRSRAISQMLAQQQQALAAAQQGQKA